MARAHACSGAPGCRLLIAWPSAFWGVNVIAGISQWRRICRRRGEIDGLKCPSLPLEADLEGEAIASSSRLTVKPRNSESFELCAINLWFLMRDVMDELSGRPENISVYICGGVPRSGWSLHVLPASAWGFSPASSHRPSHTGVGWRV